MGFFKQNLGLCFNLELMFLVVQKNTNFYWRAPKLLDRLKCEYEVKTMEKQGVGDMLPGSQHFGVEGHAGALGWGLRIVTNINYSHKPTQTKQQVG